MGRAASVNSGWAMVGQRVNNFRILRMLGEGGMGAVYEAEHPTLRKKVAVKVLRREFAVDRAVVQRFFNEARAANSIRHPNIIEIIDLGVMPDGVPYLMMELLEGENLAQRLARDGPISVERAVDFAIQAAWALEAAHRNGIVHRDLKPDNLFLIPDAPLPGPRAGQGARFWHRQAAGGSVVDLRFEPWPGRFTEHLPTCRRSNAGAIWARSIAALTSTRSESFSTRFCVAGRRSPAWVWARP